MEVPVLWKSEDPDLDRPGFSQCCGECKGASYLKALSKDQTDYNGQLFENLLCDELHISHKEFYDCVFTKSSFRETILEDCKFAQCRFENCTLGLAHVKSCSFVETRFQDSQVRGIDWTEACWAGKGFLKPFDFYHCGISFSTFIGLNLRGVSFVKCIARDVDFTEADLTGADCSYTDFSESRFHNTNLTKADFTHATNYYIDVTQNVIQGARFSLPEAMALLQSLDIFLVE